jgi:hypothetical protein
LSTVDLDEPHPHVFRFDTLETNFRTQLERAITTPCDYAIGREWRQKTSWERVAESTALVYRKVLREASRRRVGWARLDKRSAGLQP